MRTRPPSSWMSRAAAVQPLVLVVEDEPHLGRSLVSTLAIYGFRTIHTPIRVGALSRAVGHEPDLVLADLSEGAIDRVGLVARLRDWTSAPLVALLGETHERDSAAMLDAGANDYLVKPFTTEELLARMRVWLRETRRLEARGFSPETRSERIRIDRARRSLYVEGREIHITPIECKLLLTLARTSGKAMTEEQILAALWGSASSSRVQHLRTHVRQLRQKIERDPARPRHLLTEVGGGYRLKLS